jgi:hypothetical protein
MAAAYRSAGLRQGCTAEPPPSQPHQPRQLQARYGRKLGAERLFARLVPKRLAPGIGTDGAAEEGEGEQGGFANPPLAALRKGLVEAERGKSGEVQRDEGGGEVGGGEVGEHFGARIIVGLTTKVRPLGACPPLTLRSSGGTEDQLKLSINIFSASSSAAAYLSNKSCFSSSVSRFVPSTRHSTTTRSFLQCGPTGVQIITA